MKMKALLTTVLSMIVIATAFSIHALTPEQESRMTVESTVPCARGYHRAMNTCEKDCEPVFEGTCPKGTYWTSCGCLPTRW